MEWSMLFLIFHYLNYTSTEQLSSQKKPAVLVLLLCLHLLFTDEQEFGSKLRLAFFLLASRRGLNNLGLMNVWTERHNSLSPFYLASQEIMKTPSFVLKFLRWQEKRYQFSSTPWACRWKVFKLVSYILN